MTGQAICDLLDIDYAEDHNDSAYASLRMACRDEKRAKRAKVFRDRTATKLEQRPSAVVRIRALEGDFLHSYEWRKLRMEVIVERGNRCECCGASPKDGIVINVDHILPRKTYPHLALEKKNLQVLCNPCNHGKGNWDTTDWRHESSAKAEK